MIILIGFILFLFLNEVNLLEVLLTVAIIGAGIGGLSLGLCLYKLKIPFKIYEAVKELKPLGVGINIQPHAVRELYALGLKEQLDAIGLRTREVGYFSSQGGLIWVEPRGLRAGYRWPQYSIHRGMLQMLLYDELVRRAGNSCIETNCFLKLWEHDSDGVDMSFVDKVTNKTVLAERAKVIIACDGINSTVRNKMYPDEGVANWAGIMMWRGVVKGPEFLKGNTMVMVGNKNCKFVAYPIKKFKDGDVLINWICDLRYPEDYTWLKQDWNRKGRLQDILPFFKEWVFDWMDIPTLLNATRHIFEYPMVDRNPLPNWTSDRITLLGDAAHAMYPIGSNGASQAILDSVHLAKNIEKFGITQKALFDYENIRRPIVNKIVEANRLDGPDKILDIVAERAPKGFKDIHEIMEQDELNSISEIYKKLAGFDIDRLNQSEAII